MKRAKTPAITLGFPLTPAPENPHFVVRHIDMQLDTRQAETLRRLLDTLRERTAKLANGRIVESTPDALRYVLEAIAAA